ncbi:MAG TPA: ATP-dependent 6-phosphofructokinase [Candidatus Agrococcus pullicola]|uniref:ATP-dependent 6-phosphofructokinase n=1 Tax=Candidatus Agrococcus pullicola TaxID=2838429 RepID=A0A9D1YUM8_9MICO|nr:ATP-dependent 6-phosphofructokinase [Candidatus Agrococcus pullicola]
MRIGILTSGGDCPGLNAVIRAAVLTGIKEYDYDFVGIRDGWRGLIEGDVRALNRSAVRGLSRVGGTILGTSRTHPYDAEGGGPERMKATMDRLGIDGIIAIGGEGTLAGARRLFNDGLPIVGVPKTIDNDLDATDYTFGFDTAVEIATEAGDRLRTTGDSHMRCMVLEVMGRHVGWIALHSGVSVGAHVILIPEHPVSMEEIGEYVRQVYDRGRAPLVVVSEGFKLKDMEQEYSTKGIDEANRPRLGGISEMLAPMIQEHTGIESRATVLGHIQRGGAPTGADRVLATRFGIGAVRAVADGDWGSMVALRGTDIVRVTLDEALGSLKTVPASRYEEIKHLFG